MEPLAFAAVMLAAALHASWNALVKSGLDRFLSISLISFGASALSLVALPFFSFPTAAAWPYVLISVALHVGYKMFLIRAYKSGDLGQVYAIARGTAPLLVSVAMLLIFGESLTPVAMGGVMLLICGVWFMSIRGGRELGRIERPAILFALITSAFIASYTITDGVGARINGSPNGYAAWMFFLDGCLMVILFGAGRGMDGFSVVARHWKIALGGGAMMVASYWTIIWAMTVSPIALVSALRESSVLFAALISVFVLKEPLTRWRIMAAIAIVAGIVLTKMA